jgi:TatD DNase family protein
MTNHTTAPSAAPAAPAASAASAAQPTELIDIGVNLAHDTFARDRDAVLARAANAGVVQMIVTGSSAASTQGALALARAHPQRLFATAGVHPHYASEWSQELAADFNELAHLPEVVAVGECGLDYHRNLSAPDVQRAAFHGQLQIAALSGKPVFLHQRDAHADFVAILREHRVTLCGAVAHCFTGTASELECYLELQLFIGITGWICDERRGGHLLPLMSKIPQGALMLETDAPYLMPRDLQPKPASRRNEPAYLAHIARTVAHARGDTFEKLAQETTANARGFFHLPSIDKTLTL